jgi:hypothetical protein
MTTVINDLKLTEKFVGESFHDFLTVDAFLEAVADFFTLKHITADVVVTKSGTSGAQQGAWKDM